MDPYHFHPITTTKSLLLMSTVGTTLTSTLTTELPIPYNHHLKPYPYPHPPYPSSLPYPYPYSQSPSTTETISISISSIPSFTIFTIIFMSSSMYIIASSICICIKTLQKHYVNHFSFKLDA